MLERFGKKFSAGTLLFSEGDAGSHMYVVHSGKVELTRRMKERDTLLAVVSAGQFFGEMAIINKRPRSATATVVEAGELVVIDAKTFGAMVRTHSEIAVRMIQSLASRLDRANQQVELLLLQDINHRVARCLRQMADERGESDASTGLMIPVTLEELAGRVALDEDQISAALDRLRDAHLVQRAKDAGHSREGFVIPEVGRLADFLEFLEIRDRFG